MTRKPAPAGTPTQADLLPHTCDSCRHRPGTWHATFDDGVAFDVCDDCVALVDDRVTVTRVTADHVDLHPNGVTQP